MRKLPVTLFIFSLTQLVAAQIPTSGNIFVGYSYYNTNLEGRRGGLNGWEGSVEGSIAPFVGFVGEVSGYYGSQDFTTCTVPILDCVTFHHNISQYNFLFGPRVSVSAGKFRPFAEGFIGMALVNVRGAGGFDTSLALEVGGGVDYKLARVIAWRFQGDYIHTHLVEFRQNDVRASTGIVLRF